MIRGVGKMMCALGIIIFYYKFNKKKYSHYNVKLNQKLKCS